MVCDYLGENQDRNLHYPWISTLVSHTPGIISAAGTVGTAVQTGRMVTIDDVRAFASQLPRAYEALVRDRVKFRVGRIVFLAFNRDETIMGFGFPKEERAALVAAEPDKFRMPSTSDLRYNWVHVRMSAIDRSEMEELVLDAWRMCVPKSVAAAFPSPVSPLADPPVTA
jgi:hypothetical protein